jgi:hypothetical protein
MIKSLALDLLELYILVQFNVSSNELSSLIHCIFPVHIMHASNSVSKIQVFPGTFIYSLSLIVPALFFHLGSEPQGSVIQLAVIR